MPEVGLIEGVDVYLDGTKVQANASKHKAMSYAGMQEAEVRLKKEIADLLAQAEKADAEEDARLGVGKRGNEHIPAEIRRRESRVEWIRKAKEELEAEAAKARAATLRANAAGQHAAADAPDTAPKKRRAARSRAEKAEKQASLLDKDPEPVPAPIELPAHRPAATVEGKPRPKAQRNFTDPDSRLMINGQGAFVQGYNCQAAVDPAHQVVVAVGVSNLAPDQRHAPAMLLRIEANLGHKPATLVADNGFYSEAAARFCEDRGVEPLLALSREHHVTRGSPPLPKPPPEATARERMQWRLSTEWGRERMRKRKWSRSRSSGRSRKRWASAGSPCAGSTRSTPSGRSSALPTTC